MRLVVTLLAVLGAAGVAGAQEDYELANALAEREWYDLAEEIFAKMLNSSGDAKAEGKYGIARIKVLKAEHAESVDEKSKLYDKAIAEVLDFLTQFPAHRRKSEALSDVGYLYQSKGKALMALAKADPAKLEEAEKAYAAAEKLFTDLLAQLKKEEKPRPNPEDEKKNPAQFKAQQTAFEQWDEKVMFSKYNYATALFAHAETYKDNPAKHPDMKRLLEQMINFLSKDFMWEYENYVVAYDGLIYVGRAWQILAETSAREKAADGWRQCFSVIGKGRGLLNDKEMRNNEAVREVAVRATLYEMKAYISFGDSYAEMRRSAEAAKQYVQAAGLAEKLFMLVPSARLEEMGKAIRLEQARAYCKAGQADRGIKLLQELAKQHKDTWVENVAIDLLGEFGGEQSPTLAIEAADNFFERGPAFLYRAMQKYRKALTTIKRPEDQKHVAYCWYQIGRCYFYLDRYFEAVAALSVLEKAPHVTTKEAPEAAMLKLQTLTRLDKTHKDKDIARTLEDFQAWITRTFPKQAGDQLIRQTAIGFEVKQLFMKAIDEWKKIADPSKESYEEAVFSIGFDFYRENERLLDLAGKDKANREKLAAEALDRAKEALVWFKKHLDHVDKLPTKDAKVVKNVVGSILFSCKILVHPKLNRSEEALAISADLDKRYPNADAGLSIAIMSLRLDAKLKKGLIQEAEEDLKSLKARYERDQVGFKHFSRALAVLAGAFQEAGGKEEDAEKRELFSMKAANYYYEYYVLNPTAVEKVDQMETMAEILYIAAEQRMKQGEAKLGKAGVEETTRLYAKSRELYVDYLQQQRRDLEKTDAGKEKIRAINARITTCLLRTGQFKEAIEMYETATRDDPGMLHGSNWEEKANCYVEKAKSLPRGKERDDLLKEADKIYAQLGARLMQSKFDEHTWRMLWKHAETLFELGALDDVRNFFLNFERRGHAPAWDENKWGFKTKFDELKKTLDEKVPPRKP